MKNIILIGLLSMTVLSVCRGQSSGEKLNLNPDFEQIFDNLPVGWGTRRLEGYTVSSDSITKKQGKYSVLIEFSGESAGYQPITVKLPQNYEGKQITLSGYIKTEDVTDGYAGLWMRIDPQVAFNNMSQNGVTGTTDWHDYKITLNMNPSKTTQIFLGALLVGKGKMWVDDLHITIDGKDIQYAPIYREEIKPAEKDTVFDSGSGIIFPELNKEIIQNLELLGKIWGFLKYHHPEIGKGNYNWDAELFRMLPGYLKTSNKRERDKFLLNWINKYGNIPACNACKPAVADALLKPNHEWMEHNDMNAALKKRLHAIYENRHQGEHFYIDMFPNVGNPDFLHEKDYVHMPYPDAGFRLLALYRYWNMVFYFNPNIYLTDKNWNNLLEAYISLFLNARNELEYELATLRIIGDLKDTHANLWGGANKIHELRGNMSAPFRVQFIEKQLVVTDYPDPEDEYKARTGLKIGDVITHINGKSIESIVDSLKIYYPDGKETQRIGIVPDVYIEPTIWGIKNGKDEVLDKAIEIINNSHLAF